MVKMSTSYYYDHNNVYSLIDSKKDNILLIERVMLELLIEQILYIDHR